jgi:hypothetical protein
MLITSKLASRRLHRLAGAITGTALLAGAALAGGGAVGTTLPTTAGDSPGSHTVVRAGLDNPRSLQILRSGNVLVAEAGRGSRTPAGCSRQGCAGPTGEATLLTGGRAVKVLDGLQSLAGEDGSFAVGADGASKRPGGGYVAVMADLPGRQGGKLVGRGPRGGVRIIADIARYEERNDPDGEGVESNPYAVLGLRSGFLVADAAGDSILKVRPNGRIRTWAVMPEYGRRVDAVPTTVSRGADGRIYVGELHSERPGKAKVLRFNRKGKLLGRIGGFTTVTGVDRAADGTLYVSELFGGSCGFDEIPECFPGRVVKVNPDGSRDYLDVPFPSGIGVQGKRVLVNAFSTSPATGFGGNPAWSGAVWRLRF